MPPRTVPACRFVPLFCCAVAVAAVVSGCGNRAGKSADSAVSLSPAGGASFAGGGGGEAPPAKRGAKTKATDTTSPILPDKSKTPGDALPVSATDVCTSGYAGKVRDVPEAVKKAVYLSYGITSRRPGQYEVDHLISLELGGSNSQKNLWPESFETQPWNARVKDKLENELHDEICDGKITIAQAQKEISGDWIASYKKHFNTNVPLQTKTKRKHGGKPPPDAAADADAAPVSAATSASAPANSSNVWVNLNSGVYWQPGTRYYGKTSKGKYETEAAAKKEGFRAAKD